MAKKRQKSESEMRSHLSAWLDSGLSQLSYCDKVGIKIGVFHYWRKRLSVVAPESNKASGSSSGRFIALNELRSSNQLNQLNQLSVASAEATPSAVPLIELSYPNGVVVKLSGHLGELDLMNLIKPWMS
jgi:hypothetical protein